MREIKNTFTTKDGGAVITVDNCQISINCSCSRNGAMLSFLTKDLNKVIDYAEYIMHYASIPIAHFGASHNSNYRKLKEFGVDVDSHFYGNNWYIEDMEELVSILNGMMFTPEGKSVDELRSILSDYDYELLEVIYDNQKAS